TKADEREQEGDHETDPDRDQRQVDVLEEGRLQGVTPVGTHPIGAEPAVVFDARARMAEVRDDRAAGRAQAVHPSRSSRVATPSGEPSSPTTRSASRPSAMSTARASRMLVSADSRGSASPAPVGGGASLRSPTLRSESALSARSRPTK